MAELLPRLQRYYHAANPMVWVSLPLPLLVAHVQMIPRLHAGEALDAAASGAIPFMSEGDRRSQVRAWEDLTGGRRVVRSKTRQEQAAAAALHGIGVRRR